MNKQKFFKKIFLTLMIAGAVFSFSNTHALTITPIRMEIAGDPGQTLSKEMTLINERDTPETYYVTYSNFESQGETGSPQFTEAKDDLGTWMTAQEKVVLAPKSSKIVQVKISIPTNADPGGHFAVIFWGTTPPSTAPGEVTIGAKTGMLVLLRVNGDVNEKGGLLEFGTKDKQKYYTALPVSFYYRFQNSGGDRIKPTGDVVIRNMIGLKTKTISGNPVQGNVLPGSIRRFETSWQGKDGGTPNEDKKQNGFLEKVSYEWRNFAFGYYKARMHITYGTKDEKAESVASFWVFPWHLTIFVLILLIILFFGIRKILRNYNHWVIKKAEEMLEHIHEEEEKKHPHEVASDTPNDKPNDTPHIVPRI